MCGNPLVILGTLVTYREDSVVAKPEEQKAIKWSHMLTEALETGVMKPGAASKAAGRLMWAAQKSFRRAGRAMVRPFYAQQYAPRRGGRLSPTLTSACEWWLVVLRSQIGQACPLRGSCAAVVDLFTDARGDPARIGAVGRFAQMERKLNGETARMKPSRGRWSKRFHWPRGLDGCSA